MIDIAKLLPNAYFGTDEETPTIEDIACYVKHTMRHSVRVHFYLHELGIIIEDGETPHDLIGIGNKLEWEVIKGFAYKNQDTEEKKAIFEKSLERHRMQRHHRMWNTENPEATELDMKYGAVDSISSLIENREYQGGKHNKIQIEKKILCNPKYKQKWMFWALDEIIRINEHLEEKDITYYHTFLKNERK